ncbi:MAG: hypothetical protein ACE361_05215 [Aureliella sp.]
MPNRYPHAVLIWLYEATSTRRKASKLVGFERKNMDSEHLEPEQSDTNSTGSIGDDTEITTTTDVEATAEVSDDLGSSISDAEHLDDPKAVELSTEFVGRWSTLISTTNWEKGKIIQEWREALMGSEAPAASYSDEAWSRRVGGVTPQHVGRLRRVYDRFGAEFESYQQLYWSHFLAALDWDDAQMWLEGASQSGWSVSQMRKTRWEASGADPEQTPTESQIVAASQDEDYTPLNEVDSELGVQDDSRSVAEGPRAEDPDFGDEHDISGSTGNDFDSDDDDALPWEDEAGPQESPFANLPSLPVDLAEALEQFKLAIIRHRSSSWSEVDQQDVMRSIEALKMFAAQ